MAGWNYTPPLAGGTDFTDPSLWGQFYHAVNERCLVVGDAPMPLPQAGAPICAVPGTGGNIFPPSGILSPDSPPYHCSITGLQQAIEYFITWAGTVGIDIAAGPFIDTTQYTGGTFATTPAFWSLRTLRTAAGLNVNGFTRKYRGGDGSVVVAYGVAQDGDFLGPWLFDELMAVLNLLTMTWQAGLAWTANGEANAKAGYGTAATWAAAKAAAEAAWAAAAPDIYSGPLGVATGQYFSGPPVGYFAGLNRQYLYARFDPPTGATGLSYDVDFYTNSRAYDSPPGTYDANGDGLTESLFARFAQLTAQTGTALGKLGSLAKPTWGATPTPTSTYLTNGYRAVTNITYGGTVYGAAAAVNWAVAGGFAFRP